MLTDDQRRTIISIITNGSSRRVAAQYVRCATSTITRLATRDPEFARQLAAAEKSAEIDALRAIRAAARKDRYWRAAAWLLERKNPEDFAPRPPTLFTGEQVFEVITQIVEYLHEDLPESNSQRAMQRLEQLIETCRLEQTTPILPDPKPEPQISDPEYFNPPIIDVSDPYQPSDDFCCRFPDLCPQPYHLCRYYPELCPHQATLPSTIDHEPSTSPKSPTPKMQHPTIANPKDTISPPTVTPNNKTTSNTQH